ncbi:hypothetical protein [Dactylosporangium sp. CA-092794]|uniref:hypothetical protein n=1 Tax=Dactylosporangium sp. CA-092794 TaxID=3239929 RepID=UPI003D92F3F5
MESWDTFAVVVGGAAAALLGLLFVAISIRLNVVAASTELRNRAAQTLVLFGSALVTAILLALPGQPLIVFGVELMIVGALAGVGLLLLDRRAGRAPTTQPISRILDTVSPNTITSLLFIAAGLVLVLGISAGLYVMVAPILTAFVGGVASAWLFMTRVEE